MKIKRLVFLIAAILLLAACQSEETATEEVIEQAPPATAIPTATLPAAYAEADPRSLLGKPDGVDTFDTTSNWTLFNNDCFQSNITGGQMVMTAKGMEGISCWTFSWPMLQHAYLETEAVVPDTCQANDRYGMIYRSPDNQRGYLLGLSCDGRYSLNLFDGINTTVLVAPASDPAVKTGAGEVNRLGVAFFGNEHILYVNGVRMATAFDSTYLNPGRIGYFVNASTTNAFSSAYNELAAWVLDDEFQPPDTTTPPPTTPVPPPGEGAPSVTAITFLNVRSGPSTLYPIYFVAQPGAVGEVVGQSQDGQWWAIVLPASVTDTQTGWVSGDFTVFSNPNNVSIPVLAAPPLPPSVPVQPPPAGSPVATAVDVMNVRSGPGSQFPSYGVASIGQSAPAIGQNQDGSWIAISIPTTIAPDGIGWVVASAVQISPAGTQLPVITP